MKEQFMKVYLLACTLCVMIFTLACQPKSYIKRKVGYRKHTIQMKDLEQTYHPFKSTEMDLFSLDQTVRRQTKVPPKYINYYTFKIREIDQVNRDLATLYAQYHFMSFTLFRFDDLIQKLTKKDPSLVDSQELKTVLESQQTQKKLMMKRISLISLALQQAQKISLFTVKESQRLKRQAYHAYSNEKRHAFHLQTEIKEEKKVVFTRIEEMMNETPKVVTQLAHFAPLIREIHTYDQNQKKPSSQGAQSQGNQPQSGQSQVDQSKSNQSSNPSSNSISPSGDPL